jgi:hypothetical protein
MLCCGLDNLEPNRPRLDAGGPASRIDRDPSHPFGLEQDCVLKRAERSGAVAGALRRDPQAELACEQNSCRDILRRLRKRHRRRSLVDRQVPRPSGFVEARVLGDHDLACHSRSQPARREVLYGHQLLPVVVLGTPSATSAKIVLSRCRWNRVGGGVS